MRRISGDESGQVYTMEGVIAGLMLVLALTYIIGSTTLLSPQTEKTTSVKLTIKAQDLLTVLGTVNQASNMSSPLLRDIAGWKGTVVTPGSATGETYVDLLNNSLYNMLPRNIFYNVNLTYYNDSIQKMENKNLIYTGEPIGNTASASKTIILNSGDLRNPSQWWGMTTPKVVDVRLILWTL